MQALKSGGTEDIHKSYDYLKA
jgi:hypothetical protein